MHEIETLSLALLLSFYLSLTPSLFTFLPVSVFLALGFLALAMWRRPFSIVGIDHLALVTRHWPFGTAIWHCRNRPIGMVTRH